MDGNMAGHCDGNMPGLAVRKQRETMTLSVR